MKKQVTISITLFLAAMSACGTESEHGLYDIEYQSESALRGDVPTTTTSTRNPQRRRRGDPNPLLVYSDGECINQTSRSPVRVGFQTVKCRCRTWFMKPPPPLPECPDGLVISPYNDNCEESYFSLYYRLCKAPGSSCVRAFECVTPGAGFNLDGFRGTGSH
jgi:hypothetical protein